ncbi:MAG: hypothetical protein ACI8PQ_003049 [Planctomycetota bacterium]
MKRFPLDRFQTRPLARPLASLMLVAALCLSFASVGFSQDANSEQESSVQRPSPRERWMQKSPEERAVLRRRFEELSHFEPELQVELRRRAREVSGTLRSLDSAPPPWVRERLDVAGPGQRDRELRRCLEDHRRRRGSDMRDRLPKDLRERLENAKSDEERAAVFRELSQRGRSDMFPRMVARMGRHLELDPSEVERLSATEPEGQRTVLENLKRRSIVARGKPEDIDAKDWTSWQSLDDREFLRKVEFSIPSHRGWRQGPGMGDGKREEPRDGSRGDTDRRDKPGGSFGPGGRGEGPPGGESRGDGRRRPRGEQPKPSRGGAPGSEGH